LIAPLQALRSVVVQSLPRVLVFKSLRYHRGLCHRTRNCTTTKPPREEAYNLKLTYFNKGPHTRHYGISKHGILYKCRPLARIPPNSKDRQNVGGVRQQMVQDGKRWLIPLFTLERLRSFSTLGTPLAKGALRRYRTRPPR
jgi:hypothetical protein